MKKEGRVDIVRFCVWSVMGIALLLASWILFLRLDDGLQIPRPKYLVVEFFAVLILAAGVYSCRHSKGIWLLRSKSCVILAVLAGILGIGARMAFLYLGDDYLPYGKGSDTGVHWYMAQEILETGEIQSYIEGVYEALFSHLMTYTALLSTVMRIFGISYAAVLFLNIVCDVIAAIAIYMLLAQWKDRRVASFAVVLWMLNPLGIVFCAEGLALSITNMFIALSFLSVYFLWQAFQKKDFRNFLLSAVGTGLIFALGNAFRVLFTVLLIAVVILLLVYCIQNFEKKNVAYTAVGVLVIIVTMFGSSLAMTKVYQHVNPYYTEKHSIIGWSILIGANYDSQGRWSYEDWEQMSPRYYNDEMTPEEINNDFMNMAIDRYRKMSFSELAVHILNKIKVLFEHNDTAIFKNIEEQFSSVTGLEEWIVVVNHLGLVTLTIFAFLQFLFFAKIFNKAKRLDWFSFFLALCFCGLLLSSLLVEVMSRYIFIFLVTFVIFSACALVDLLYKDQSNASLSK